MNSAIRKGWISGLLAALAASLCCIAPLLAVFGGISGAATYFNWVEPLRPYIIGITVLIFAVAWYEKLVIAPRQENDCCNPAINSFWQSKKFLLVVTLFSVVLIAFPYYSPLFYKMPSPSSAKIGIQPTIQYVRLNIKGMGCADCTKHIDGTLMGMDGVASSNTSFEKHQTVVGYNPTRINADSINNIITGIGYQSTLIKNN